MLLCHSALSDGAPRILTTVLPGPILWQALCWVLDIILLHLISKGLRPQAV